MTCSPSSRRPTAWPSPGSSGTSTSTAAEDPAALLGRLAAEDFGPQGAALVQRLESLHANEPSVDVQDQLRLVVDRLRLQAIDDELKLIFESGELSEPTAARARDLDRQRAELKHRLTTA